MGLSTLHLDALNRLVDVFQQGFVLRHLILLLVGVDVRQRRHIVLKVLLADRFLQGKRPKVKEGASLRHGDDSPAPVESAR